MVQGGIFLDRDGTINDEVHYLSSPSQLRLLPGSADAIREANDAGLPVFIITNQSGIARGVLTEQQLEEIHRELFSMLGKHRARITASYYCPHHPDLGVGIYRTECDCRKPKAGMIMKAVKEFGIDPTHSFVIGDRMIDVQTGKAVGASTILVLTGYGREELELCKQNGIEADHVSENLYDAMQVVIQAVHQK